MWGRATKLIKYISSTNVLIFWVMQFSNIYCSYLLIQHSQTWNCLPLALFASCVALAPGAAVSQCLYNITLTFCCSPLVKASVTVNVLLRRQVTLAVLLKQWIIGLVELIQENLQPRKCNRNLMFFLKKALNDDWQRETIM